MGRDLGYLMGGVEKALHRSLGDVSDLMGSPRERWERIRETLVAVGLEEVLVLDEPTSALDVSIQARSSICCKISRGRWSWIISSSPTTPRCWPPSWPRRWALLRGRRLRPLEGGEERECSPLMSDDLSFNDGGDPREAHQQNKKISLLV